MNDDEPLGRDMQHPFATSSDAHSLIRRGDRKARELERQQRIRKGGEGITIKGNVVQADPNQFPNGAPGGGNFPVTLNLCVQGAPGAVVVAGITPAWVL